MRICILGLRILICAAIFLVVLSPGCRSEKPEESGDEKSEPNAIAASLTDSVAVTVNGVEITRSKVEQLIKPQLDSLAGKTRQLPAHVIEQYTQQFRQQALERLIREELLDAKIRQANITITDDKVMSQMEEIASAQGVSLEDFIKTMAQHDHSLEQMKEDLRERLARNQFMETQWAGKINVTEDDAKKYHDEKPEQFKIPEQVRVSHILIGLEQGVDPNEAKARARTRIEGLLKQIKDGADFAELARANSACPSAPKGGDLDFFPRGKTTPAFEKVAFELQVGQISDVVETEYGFHIIKATDHEDPSGIAFEQAKEKIIEQLTAEKQSEFADEYLKKLMAEAKIAYPTSI
ncbi:MAG: peptidylprolyl isomerase [Planctomycetes bacterium]|nr:peptidylprolyl isomerase [Planctomycetota bacterium]